MTPRLLLVDTHDRLPGLLPLHAWSALHSSDLVVVRGDDHPFLPALQLADLRVELVGEVTPAAEELPLTRGQLLSGLSGREKAEADWLIDRTEACGVLAYLFGPHDTDAFTRHVGMEAARREIEVEVVYFGAAPRGTALLELVAVQERLLGPDGCPWDREQTHASLAPYAIEEVHELVDAIAEGDPAAIAEELGDVLLQVTFHAELGHRAGTFDIDAVAEGIAAKLVRRHPHVFGDTEVAGAAEVMANWEQIKADEKPERTGPFDGVPRSLPAVALAAKLQSRAERLGFRWTGVEEVADRVAEELGEVLAADGAAETTREVGDLLLAAVALARQLGVDPEHALRQAAQRFRARAERMFAAVGADDGGPVELTAEQWRAAWADAKAGMADDEAT